MKFRLKREDGPEGVLIKFDGRRYNTVMRFLRTERGMRMVAGAVARVFRDELMGEIVSKSIIVSPAPSLDRMYMHILSALGFKVVSLVELLSGMGREIYDMFGVPVGAVLTALFGGASKARFTIRKEVEGEGSAGVDGVAKASVKVGEEKSGEVEHEVTEATLKAILSYVLAKVPGNVVVAVTPQNFKTVGGLLLSAMPAGKVVRVLVMGATTCENVSVLAELLSRGDATTLYLRGVSYADFTELFRSIASVVRNEVGDKRLRELIDLIFEYGPFVKGRDKYNPMRAFMWNPALAARFIALYIAHLYGYFESSPRRLRRVLKSGDIGTRYTVIGTLWRVSSIVYFLTLETVVGTPKKAKTIAQDLYDPLILIYSPSNLHPYFVYLTKLVQEVGMPEDIAALIVDGRAVNRRVLTFALNSGLLYVGKDSKAKPTLVLDILKATVGVGAELDRYEAEEKVSNHNVVGSPYRQVGPRISVGPEEDEY